MLHVLFVYCWKVNNCFYNIYLIFSWNSKMYVSGSEERIRWLLYLCIIFWKMFMTLLKINLKYGYRCVFFILSWTLIELFEETFNHKSAIHKICLLWQPRYTHLCMTCLENIFVKIFSKSWSVSRMHNYVYSKINHSTLLKCVCGCTIVL